MLGQRSLSEQSGELQAHAHVAPKFRQAFLLGTFARNHQRWSRRQGNLPKSSYQNVEALDRHEPSSSEQGGWAKTQAKSQALPFFARAPVEGPRIERRGFDAALRSEAFRIGANERGEAFTERSAGEYELGPVAAKNSPQAVSPR